MMKKFLWMTALIAALAVFFMGCPNGDDPDSPIIDGPTVYDITFRANTGLAAGGNQGAFPDGQAVIVKQFAPGAVIVPPPDPVRAGYKFDRWVPQANGGGTALTAATTATGRATYYAMYTEENLAADFELVFTADVAATNFTNVGTTNGIRATYFKDIKNTEDKTLITALQETDNATGILVLKFDATGGQGENRNGWGIGKLGIYDGDYTALTSANPSPLTYEIRVEVSWVLGIIASDSSGATGIGVFTAVNNGDKLVGVELYKPKEARSPVAKPSLPEKPAKTDMNTAYYDWVQEISTVGGDWLSANAFEGKGDIAGTDLAKVLENAAKGTLRFYVRNVTNPFESRSGWNDVGTIGGTTGSGTNKDVVNIAGGANTDWFFDVKVSDILTAMKTENPTFIRINPYNKCIVVRCDLFVQKEGVKVPDFTLELAYNSGGSNYQADVTDVADVFPGVQFMKGDKVTVKFSVKSDTTITSLNLLLVDCGPPSYTWKEISETEAVTGITASTEKEIEVTFTVDDWAGSNAKLANRLILNTTGLSDKATLEIFDFTFEIDDTDREDLPEDPFEFPQLDGATMLEETDTGKWAFGSMMNTFKAAKYIIVATVAEGSGFGGINVGIQGDGTTDAWKLEEVYTGDWTNFTRPKKEMVFIVIDIAQLPNYAALIAGSNAQFVIGWGLDQLGEYKAYITDQTLTKPAGAVDADGDNSTASGKIYFSTTIDLDVITPSGPEFPEFDNAVTLPEWDTSGTNGVEDAKWTFSGTAFSDFTSAKYVVIASYSGVNVNGYGGIQPYVQGDGVNAWTQTGFDTGNWTSFGHSGEELVYFVFDLSAFAAHTQLAGDSTAATGQFGFNWGGAQFGTAQGYITSENLTKPAGATDLTTVAGADDTPPATVFGYITKTLPVGLNEK